MEPYVGELRIFAGTFAPRGWALWGRFFRCCDYRPAGAQAVAGGVVLLRMTRAGGRVRNCSASRPTATTASWSSTPAATS